LSDVFSAAFSTALSAGFSAALSVPLPIGLPKYLKKSFRPIAASAVSPTATCKTSPTAETSASLGERSLSQCVRPDAIDERHRQRLSLTCRTPRRTRKRLVLIEIATDAPMVWHGSSGGTTRFDFCQSGCLPHAIDDIRHAIDVDRRRK
jgi:hypothetical protein